MPGYIIHIATAQEYLRKHKKEFSEEFIEGTIAPDFTNDKSKTHYGKSPAYANLNNFLQNNSIDTDFNKGYFLHLVTDYLFYNKYLTKISKPQIYDDYDFTNKYLIEKYNIIIPKSVKDKVFFKEGKPQLLSLEMVNKLIEEVSNLNLEDIQKEVKNNNPIWNSYKNLV